MGLEVVVRGLEGGKRDGADRIVGIIMGSSLLRGVTVSRLVLGRDNSWAGLSGSLGLAIALGGRGRGGRGITTVGIVVRARALGSELRNGRARELVGSVAEGVDEDTRIGVLVGTRESDEFIWAGGSGLATTDVDLDAAGVELGTARLIGQMKGDDLVTEEISTMSQVGGKLEGVGLSVD